MGKAYFPEELVVIIPVGGVAKRLLPITAEVSKAVVRFLNRPLVELALVNLARQGVRNFIFGVKGYVNYKSLHDYFKDGLELSSRYGIEPRLHIKYQPRVDDKGSADSFRINMEYYDIKQPVLGVQGDNVFELDLIDLLNFHADKDAFMTVGLTEVERVEEYGVAVLDEDGSIKRFVEKPRPEEAPSRLVNSGLYLLSPEVRDVLSSSEVVRVMEERGRLDFGMDFIPYLIEKGYKVYGYMLKGHWYDVGSPERYLEAITSLLRSGCSWLHLHGRISEQENVWVEGFSSESAERRADIVRKARAGRIRLEGAVLIGRHCLIGDDVEIKDSCIDDFCIIEDGARIEGSAVMDRSLIGRCAEVRRSIVGRHVAVRSSKQSPTRVVELSVLGDNTTVGEGCDIVASRVYPHNIIPPHTKLVNSVIESMSIK